jgi:hypothetical protein
MLKYSFIVVLIFLVCVNGLILKAQEQSSSLPEVFKKPDTLVKSIYKAVSSEIGSTPDWKFVRSHFHAHAVIVLRASRTESKKFNLDGFIQDFVDFYKRIDPTKNSFKEDVVFIKTFEYGNIAHCYVVYEASVSSSKRPPQKGLDSWHLMKTGEYWTVISVVNEIELAAGPIPRAVYQE